MRKQYLWIDRRGADLHWGALGNLNLGPAGKGTLVMWVRLPITNVEWPADRLWTIYCDTNNYMTTNYGHGMWVTSGGVGHGYQHPQIDRTRDGDWELLTFQWDFSQGVLHSYYNDAQPGSEALTSVPTPVGAPQHLQVGYAFSNPTTWAADDLLVHGVAIWDDLLTTGQITALYERGRLDEIHENDGTGNLTFLLRLNDGLEADVAGGDSACTVRSTTPADRYCLLPDGLRRLGTMTYPIGLPRHDGHDDDRKPLNAICPLNWDSSAHYTALSDNNHSTYGVLRVQSFTDVHGAGARCRRIPRPGTYRQLVHVPNENNFAGTEVGLGPVLYKHYPSACTGVFDQYGSGRGFTVVADAENTASSFKTDLDSRFANDYWKGAWVSFYSGNCQGRSLMVVGYDAAAKKLTLESALPATPSTGSVGMVNPYPRLIARSSNQCQPDYRYAMEANLWAQDSTTNKAFTELEWMNTYTSCLMRYHRGRTAVMPGVPYYTGTYGILYGKGYGTPPAGGTNLELWLRKVEIAGPQRYQILRREAKGPGPALTDNFMVLARDDLGNGSDSVKVWRQNSLALTVEPPMKFQDHAQATADLAVAGTWRHHAAGPPIPVVYDDTTHTPVCALLGQDASGKVRLGYVTPRWDEATGRVLWSDETPPAGKQNPFLEWSALRTDVERDAPLADPGWMVNILRSVDGSWSLFYGNKPDIVDDLETYALHGATDRWSFNFATQFAGPVIPMFKGVDARDPITGNGFTPWANMHLPWSIIENPYAQQIERRFVGFAGGKTIYNDASTYSNYVRPVVGCAGADTKSLTPLPYGNAISPLPGTVIHSFAAVVLGQEDCLGIMYQHDNTSGVGLMTSEDGVHFQKLFNNWPTPPMLIPPQELPGESFHLVPGSMLRLGDRRIYYYNWDYCAHHNFVWTRWNGETHYDLTSEKTEGWLETAILERPAGGWPELFVNAAPGEGTIRVELRDPALEQPLAGWTREDCDAIGDNVRGRVSWGSLGLPQMDAQYLRLRVYLERNGAEAATPKLYGWETGAQEAVKPQVSALQVEGQTAPAGLGATHPRFSWTYQNASGRAQTAYQVQVASSQDLLTSGTPDRWDTGVVLGGATSTIYGGQPLDDFEMYFWRVRVRDTEGVWSEEW